MCEFVDAFVKGKIASTYESALRITNTTLERVLKKGIFLAELANPTIEQIADSLEIFSDVIIGVESRNKDIILDGMAPCRLINICRLFREISNSIKAFDKVKFGELVAELDKEMLL
jgi:hypothetical protein